MYTTYNSFIILFLTQKTSVVATSKKNASVSLVFSFLYKIVQVGSQSFFPYLWSGILAVTTNCCCLQVFSEYFKELEEESIRDNFVIIYELMDELMDFGYPQTTDSKILQEWVPGTFCWGIHKIANSNFPFYWLNFSFFFFTQPVWYQIISFSYFFFIHNSDGKAAEYQ